MALKIFWKLVNNTTKAVRYSQLPRHLLQSFEYLSAVQKKKKDLFNRLSIYNVYLNT